MGVLDGEPPVKTVELSLLDYEFDASPKALRFYAATWFVEWILITIENGDKFFCKMDGWIDLRYVFREAILKKNAQKSTRRCARFTFKDCRDWEKNPEISHTLIL